MKIDISNGSNEPIYKQIFDQIQLAILQGELKEGEALPSIRNLAKALKVSVITTKRAYENLEYENYIKTIPGKGSFVAKQNSELIHRKQHLILQDQLLIGIKTAKLLGLTLSEIQEMISLLYRNEIEHKNREKENL
ncbi:GntR family transcriptional regulator [Desulfitobacterium sp. AusDCA]|uniref:GntR family transcriptional regulator n=1 Tax=Desulfitobacterium sp. AusDCA TaxID=3240383 RepID=UPI003DA6F2AC